MGILQSYSDRATDIICKMHPNLKRKKVQEQVDHFIKLHLQDPTIHMENSIMKKYSKITLTKLCNWIELEKPVTSGNATFYMQPTEKQSPTAKMLDTMMKERKAIKKLLFNCKPGTDEYFMYDLQQQNLKVVMNAEYGASGNPTAAFYNIYDPAATTTMAQSIITTMASFFEGLIGDNHRFYHINECFDWITAVLKKTDKIPNWVHRPTWQDASARIKEHLNMPNERSFKLIDKYVETCDQDQICYLYYANNLKGFIKDHKHVQDLIECVLSRLPSYVVATDELPDEYSSRFENVEKYNKWIANEMFLNPNSIPEIIKNEIQELSKLISQFVYVEYLIPDSIEKLNSNKRKVILLLDTDSNVLNANIFVDFILREIFYNATFGRDKLYNEMIVINIFTYIISKPIASILDFYGRCHNMDDNARAHLSMKNELMFRRLFLMDVKKRYAASIVLREGNIIIPFKTDIKGLDFMKRGITDEVGNHFKKMLEDNILFPDEVDLHGLYLNIKRLEKDIKGSLMEGNIKYLKGETFKMRDEENSKSNPWGQPSFRGTIAWNELYPEQTIYNLDKIKLVKTIIMEEKDMVKLKERSQEWYDRINKVIFQNVDQRIRKSGIRYICMPNNIKEIPEWIRYIIDYDIIISDMISSFKSIIDSLKIKTLTYKTPNGDATMVTPLIEL